MFLRPSFSTRSMALAGLCTLVCLTFVAGAFAASDNEVATEDVTTPSAIIKWDRGANTMTPVEAKQAAELMEQVRHQLEERFLATGRITPADALEVETTATGLKKLKANIDMMNFAVVRVGEEGQLVQGCADDTDDAAKAAQVSSVVEATPSSDSSQSSEPGQQKGEH